MNVNAVFQDLCNESTNMREYSIRSQTPAGLLKYSHLLCAMMNGLLDKSLKVEVVPGSAFFMALVITRAQYNRIPNDFIKTAKKSFGARVGISQPDPDDDKRIYVYFTADERMKITRAMAACMSHAFSKK